MCRFLRVVARRERARTLDFTDAQRIAWPTHDVRCGADRHTVNFVKGGKTQLAHIAFEVKDMSQMLNACDLMGTKNQEIEWGPVRHGPGHNVAFYHRDPDGNTVELKGPAEL